MFAQYNNFQPAINDTASPSMGTPYLDSSVDTPFLDTNSADTPPFFDMTSDISPYLMYASFGVPSLQQYNNNGPLNGDNKDVCIARYLESHEQNDIAKLTHDPIKFNGDPSLLLIDKTKSPFMSSYQIPTKTETKPSPTVKLETVTEEESDSLFPPLNSSQQSINESKFDKDIMSLDELLGFDATSPLSESLDEEEAKDEKAQTQSQQTREATPVKQETSTEESSSRKRKASSTAVSETTVKRKKTTTVATKNKTIKKVAKPKQVKLYECPLCDHVSKRRYNLSTHIKTHDKARVKEFDCSQCSKSFDRRHDRDRHLATVHRGERVFNCSDCGSHFSRRDALNRHLIQRHEYDETDLIE
jgi:uncharacterized C2H2 Zn-finger protein